MNAQKELSKSGIYTATQCTDVSDCQIAIEQLEQLARVIGWSTPLQKRYASLFKRKNKLQNG